MLVCTLTLAAAAFAQEAPQAVEGPFLIPSVRAWVDGEVPEATIGLLLYADGSQFVVSGGADASAYPDATVIEADEDWILYPGLLHADFPEGLGSAPANPYVGTASDPTVGPIPAMEYGEHGSFFGHLFASDFADWDVESPEDWRALGFTAGALLPNRGLLQGKLSMLSFNGRPLAESLLMRDGHSLLSLRGSGGYPQTQMAALAMLRQVLLDQDLESLSPDLVVGNQVIVRANGPRQIENILDLHRDFAAEDDRWVILGGAGAWKHAARLKEQNMAVLYRMSFTEAAESEEELEADDGDGRPYWQDPLRLREEKRRRHQEVVDDYLMLRATGVPCALVAPKKADDLGMMVAQWTDEVGLKLSTDEIYFDLAKAPAAHLGYSKKLNGYVLSRGPYDFEEPNLAWVFTDGRGWEYPAPEVEEEGASEEGEEGSDDEGGTDGAIAAGVWDLVVETPMGNQEFSIDLDPENNKVYVFQAHAPKDRDAATGVKYQGDRLKFTFQVPEPEFEAKIFIKVEGDKMRGKMVTPWGDTPLTGEPGKGTEVAQDDDADAADDDEAEGGIATGHPQWPVETRLDRFAPSEWAQKRERKVLFRGATLYRMDGSEPAVSDLLVEDGRISKIGEDLALPAGVPEFDASGMHLMPGVIDAHSHLALDAVNEGSMAITAEVRIADMIHPESVGIYRAAAGGTALVQSLHGSANPIGGQAATWEMDYLATSIEDLLIPEAPRNIKFALGENVKQSNWSAAWGKRFPNSRVGVQATFRRAFRDAQDYKLRRTRAEQGLDPGFRRDVRLEVLSDILDNKVHIQCHSYRADELLMFLEICKEFGIEGPTFQHVLEGYKVAPELAEYGAMASTFSDWWAYKFEVRDAIPWNVNIMDRAGVTVSINSDSDEVIRRLNTEAAKGMLYGGMDWQTAMATCTLNPAKQLRLEDRLGTLEVGKDATLTLFDGPPLSGYSRCRMTLARGVVIYEAPTNLDSRWGDYSMAIADFVGAATAETEAEPQAHDLDTRDQDEAWERWTHNGKGHAVAIEGATIHPIAGEPFVGNVLLLDGRIANIQKGQVPGMRRPGMEVVKAEGKHLYPGFVSGFDRTGLYEIGAVRSSRDDIEIGTDQPDLSIASAIHADSDHIQVTRFNGVAYVMVGQNSGRIRGQTALIQLDGVTTEDLVLEEDLGLFLQFPRVSRFEQEDGPETPDEVEELNRMFDEARTYAARMQRFADANASDFRRDAKLEALVPYLEGRRDVYLYANDAPTIMAARAWAREQGIRPVYIGARDAWKVAGYLGRDQARVIVGAVHRLPGSQFDPFDAPYRCAAVLRMAGCTVGFTTDDPEFTRNLPFQGATAAAWGLGRPDALHALTLGAAEALGVDRFIGSIEEGKVATVFLTSGDPLLLQDPVERMWIAGKEVELTSKQTRLRDRYMERLK